MNKFHIIGARKGKEVGGTKWAFWWTDFVHLVGYLVSSYSILLVPFITVRKWVLMMLYESELMCKNWFDLALILLELLKAFKLWNNKSFNCAS